MTLASIRKRLKQAGRDASALEEMWSQWVASGQVPLVEGQTVIFLYRGEARSVAWRADFTGWGEQPDLTGMRVGQSDLWQAETQLPLDARIEYHILIDGVHEILDPANPRQEWGGISIKSVVEMPDYAPPAAIEPRPDRPMGTLTPWRSVISTHLAYTVQYRVYLPAGYAQLDDLPVVYVLDGQDYSHPQMGALPIVLDNLIADGRIRPVMAVLIDPRDPNDLGKNRRAEEFLENPNYAAFVSEELVPAVDRAYRTDTRREARAVVGASYGGVAGFYLCLKYPGTFGLLGAQSPVLERLSETQTLIEKHGYPALKMFVTSGKDRFWDVDITGLEPALKRAGLNYRIVVVNEGHSYGQWRAQLADMLTFFFGV